MTTAQRVAARRLGFERLPAPFGDPTADERLARDVAAGVEASTDETMGRYLQARTTFFDRVVLNALEREVTQVVIVGAGYDGRALRYAKAGVTWFEVDLPGAQADKRERLGRLGIATGHIVFVPADLRDGGLAAALVAAGYDPQLPAMALCEGVAVYLDLPVIESTLRALREVSAIGCRLAISVSASSPEVSEHRRRFTEAVAAMGEPARTFLGAEQAGVLLERTGWAVRELSERARRAGFLVAEPAWAPAPAVPGEPPAPPAPGTAAAPNAAAPYVPIAGPPAEQLLAQVHHRSGLGSLPAHLEAVYGIKVAALTRLDVGVLRVDRADGQPWVARVFSAARPVEAAEGDAAILRRLEEEGLPTERLAHPEAVSVHEGQAVVVTRFAGGTPAVPEAPTFAWLGDLLGRLHSLPGGGSLDRPGGGWHHLGIQGTVADEMTAILSLLADARRRVPEPQLDRYEALQQALAGADDCHDLPHALVHPDPVPVNVVSGSGGGDGAGPVLVDWTGAGRGPRLPSLGFLLWAAAARGEGSVEAVVSGYRAHVQLEADELSRLDGAIALRWLVLQAWAYCAGRRGLLGVAGELAPTRARARAVANRVRVLLAARPA